MKIQTFKFQWVPVEYFNNKIICDLVEERHRGIIDILDEECLRPGEPSDKTFLTKLEETMGKHPHFVTWVLMIFLFFKIIPGFYCKTYFRHALGDSKVRKTIGYEEFRLLHYAGDVTYNVNGWCCCFNCMCHVINHRLISSQVSSIRTMTCCIETWKKRCRNRATMSSRRSSRSRKYRSMLFKFWLTAFWLVYTNLRLAICNCASKLLYCRLSIVFVYWFEFIAILFNNFLFFYFCYVFVFGKDN